MAAVYHLDKEYNMPMVIGSYFIAVLGAYTASQLMCQVPSTHRLGKKLVWMALASVSLGGTGIWAMHFVKMLAMDIGIPVRYKRWTILVSPLIAVTATFITFSFELLVAELVRSPWTRHVRFSLAPLMNPLPRAHPSDDSLPLLPVSERHEDPVPPPNTSGNIRRRSSNNVAALGTNPVPMNVTMPDNALSLANLKEPTHALSSPGERPAPDYDAAVSDSSSSIATASNSNDTPTGYNDLSLDPDAEYLLREHQEKVERLWGGKTALGYTLWDLWFSLTPTVLTKGILLGLVVNAMHFSGMLSMRFEGYINFDLRLVACSASAAVITIVGALIYMPLEVDIVRQMAFAIVAPIGISIMHFVGIASGTFWTTIPPPHNRGSVQSDLPLMILVMAVTTYLLSYAMLAHLVTQSRDKLAEMIFTKRRLWKAIAEKEAFERANLIKSEFISVASHEIRTPLHAISGYTDLLLHTALTEEQATFLEAIRMGCHSIQLITNNVLDFSKLEQDSRESNARPVEVDIRSLALRVVQSCATPHRMSEVQLRRIASQGDVSPVSENGPSSTGIRLPAEKHVELLLIVEEAVPLVVHVDEVYMTRVVMNLISNALKFTEDGYVFVRVGVDEQRNGGSGPFLAISVRDSGIGIPPDSVETIFEPFRQADTSLTRSHTGAGLGLAISKQLCARMGGTINLWTKQGTGSEFTIRIPALPDSGESFAPGPALEPLNSPIPIAIAVRSAKTSELVRPLLEKRGFSVRAIDLFHPLRAQQPALSKPERLWIDMECLASTPWLLDYVISGSRDAACFVVFDDVGTDLVLRAVKLLKEAGRVALVRRPIVVHDLIRSLRQGIPRPDKETSSPLLDLTLPNGDVKKPNGDLPAPNGVLTNGVASPVTSPPIIDLSRTSLDGGFSSPVDDALRAQLGQNGHLRVGVTKDQLTKALNPLESVIHDTIAAAKAKKVRFENGQEQQDTAVTVTLELKPEQLSAEEQRARSPMPKDRRCILLVEDNLVNQKLGIRLLQKLTYDCDLAENGKVALDLVIANKSKYGLVLMDCQMPVMNGFECTRRIRALESSGAKKGHLPIIALTANVSSESRRECHQAGADLFLPKPLLMQDLKEAITQYLPSEEEKR